jgi:hypothetical protein
MSGHAFDVVGLEAVAINGGPVEAAENIAFPLAGQFSGGHVAHFFSIREHV